MINGNLDQFEIYESWAITPLKTPMQNALLPIEPIAIGTPEIEGLASYLARLAHMHNVSFGYFVLNYLIPNISKKYSLSRRVNGYFYLLILMRELNGNGIYATNLVEAITKLKYTTVVSWTTFISWKELFSLSCQLRTIRVWCAECYTDQRVKNIPNYDPLLWSLISTKICSIHQSELVNKCPNCNKRLRHIQKFYLPGHCSHCLSWLGTCDKRINSERPVEKLDNHDYNTWAVEQIGRVIAAAPTIPSKPKLDNIKKTLSVCADTLVEGDTKRLAGILGEDYYKIRSWMLGPAIPHLDALIKLSYIINIPLLKILTNHIDVRNHLIQSSIEIRNKLMLLGKLHDRSKDPLYEKIYNQMRIALKETPPPSLRKVAQSLGYRQTYALKSRFPEMSDKIIKNCRRFKMFKNNRIT